MEINNSHFIFINLAITDGEFSQEFVLSFSSHVSFYKVPMIALMARSTYHLAYISIGGQGFNVHFYIYLLITVYLSIGVVWCPGV